MRNLVFGLDQGSADVRQRGDLVVSVPNSKCGSQISKGASPPIADIRLPDAGEMLQKLKHRGVIERLTANPSPGCPRGNDDAGHAEPTAYGEAVHKLVRRTRLRRGRWHMIEDAVVLVVVENKRGLCPQVGIGRDSIDLAGDKRRAIRRHV